MLLHQIKVLEANPPIHTFIIIYIYIYIALSIYIYIYVGNKSTILTLIYKVIYIIL